MGGGSGAPRTPWNSMHSSVSPTYKPLKVADRLTHAYLDRRSDAQEWWVFGDKGKLFLGNSTGQLLLSLDLQPCVRQGLRAVAAGDTQLNHSSPLSTLINPTTWGSPGAKVADFLFLYLNPCPPHSLWPHHICSSPKVSNNQLSQAEKAGFTKDDVSVKVNAYTLLHALSNYPTFIHKQL